MHTLGTQQNRRKKRGDTRLLFLLCYFRRKERKTKAPMPRGPSEAVMQETRFIASQHLTSHPDERLETKHRNQPHTADHVNASASPPAPFHSSPHLPAPKQKNTNTKHDMDYTQNKSYAYLHLFDVRPASTDNPADNLWRDVHDAPHEAGEALEDCGHRRGREGARPVRNGGQRHRHRVVVWNNGPPGCPSRATAAARAAAATPNTAS